MKEAVIAFNVSDDFEPGYCYQCPLLVNEEYEDDGYFDTYSYCILGKNFEDCPIKIVA